jgi:tRNA threonylcarbamoyl adenosine modification protein (Sua5/YciO/YrdC/YwlC family)
LSIEAAAAAIRRREVVGLPTDTVYGIGADPLSEEAVAKLFDLKGRPELKPIGLLVASIEQAEVIGEIEGVASELAAEHWPGALTLVVTPKVILADWVGDSQSQTVGLRVPDHPVTIELLEAVGPLAVTSANLSGGAESMSDGEARAVFGDRVAVYVEGRAPGGQASTVVDVTGTEVVVLRQGPVAI